MCPRCSTHYFAKAGLGKPDLLLDLESDRLREAFERIGTFDYSAHDSVTVVLSSHGGEGGQTPGDPPCFPPCRYGWLLGSDELWVDIDVLHKALGHNPTLRGKPKMMFVQACRGGEHDKFAPDSAAPDRVADSPGRPTLHSDFLIAYATAPGTVAWRDSGSGSYFLQALAAELEAYDGTLDLQQVVQYNVAPAVQKAMVGGDAVQTLEVRAMISYRVHVQHLPAVSSCLCAAHVCFCVC